MPNIVRVGNRIKIRALMEVAPRGSALPPYLIAKEIRKEADRTLRSSPQVSCCIIFILISAQQGE
jgi:hypothetical protein